MAARQALAPVSRRVAAEGPAFGRCLARSPAEQAHRLRIAILDPRPRWLRCRLRDRSGARRRLASGGRPLLSSSLLRCLCRASHLWRRCFRRPGWDGCRSGRCRTWGGGPGGGRGRSRRGPRCCRPGLHSPHRRECDARNGGLRSGRTTPSVGADQRRPAELVRCRSDPLCALSDPLLPAADPTCCARRARQRDQQQGRRGLQTALAGAGGSVRRGERQHGFASQTARKDQRGQGE